MRVLALVIGLTLAAAPAMATEQATDKEKVVCKYEQRTGTKFPKKVCMTKAQWEQMAEETRMLMRGSASNNGSAPVERPIFPNGQ